MGLIARVQTRLAARGYTPGAPDGIKGPKTNAAIEAFKRASGLKVNSIIDSEFTALLFDEKEVVGTPWVDELLRVKGLHERNDYTKLVAWLKQGKSFIDPLKGPWCGDAVETAFSLTLPGELLPDNPLASINWLKFGVPCDARYGAVLVFWRGSPSNWQGHVGFYVGEDATHYHVLGGNQSDSVTVSRIAKGRLRSDGIRWPASAPMGKALVRAGLKPTGTTTNEA